jgi:acyl-CoA synthetase (AMP-forming)/AMP-acid ligase II
MHTPLIPLRLEQLARERPLEEAILFVDGPEWSWAEVLRRVRNHAEGLQRLGVGQGDCVLSFLPNGPLAVLNFLALSQLGAVSPMLVRLVFVSAERVGRTTGTLYAVGSIGNVLGVLVSDYALMKWFDNNTNIWVMGVVLIAV